MSVLLSHWYPGSGVGHLIVSIPDLCALAYFNSGQRYCRMLQVEHFAILSTLVKLPFVIMIFVVAIFEWPFYTGITAFVGANDSTYIFVAPR